MGHSPGQLGGRRGARPGGRLRGRLAGAAHPGHGLHRHARSTSSRAEASPPGSSAAPTPASWHCAGTAPAGSAPQAPAAATVASSVGSRSASGRSSGWATTGPSATTTTARSCPSAAVSAVPRGRSLTSRARPVHEPRSRTSPVSAGTRPGRWAPGSTMAGCAPGQRDSTGSRWSLQEPSTKGASGLLAIDRAPYAARSGRWAGRKRSRGSLGRTSPVSNGVAGARWRRRACRRARRCSPISRCAAPATAGRSAISWPRVPTVTSPCCSAGTAAAGPGSRCPGPARSRRCRARCRPATTARLWIAGTQTANDAARGAWLRRTPRRRDAGPSTSSASRPTCDRRSWTWPPRRRARSPWPTSVPRSSSCTPARRWRPRPRRRRTAPASRSAT